MVAFGTNRTMVLKSKVWKYEGHDTLLQPVSNTCKQSNGGSPKQYVGRFLFCESVFIRLKANIIGLQDFFPTVQIGAQKVGVPKELEPFLELVQPPWNFLFLSNLYFFVLIF